MSNVSNVRYPPKLLQETMEIPAIGSRNDDEMYGGGDGTSMEKPSIHVWRGSTNDMQHR